MSTKKHNIEQLHEFAKSKGGKCLSTEYVNARTKYLWEDSEGNRWYAKWCAIKNSGTWSPQTAQKRKSRSLTKYSIQDLQEHAESLGGKCLSTTYTRTKDHYKWEDSQGRPFSMSWECVLAGQWSPYEKGEVLSKLKKKYTIEELRDISLYHGYELLTEEYTTTTDHYVWRQVHTNEEVEGRLVNVIKSDFKCLQTVQTKESELCEFVQSLGLEVVRNDRKVIDPLEIDILIPELNIGIEFNGCRWHSEEYNTDKNYHINKTNIAKSKGVDLIHIWDIEWDKRKEQIKSFIKAKLGKNTKRVYARKCEVKVVNDKTIVNNFLDTYHIQGKTNFETAYGLFNSEELLSLITISKHHRGLNEYILSRYIVKTDYSVIGGLSKLVKYARQDYGIIHTWVDRRLSTGDNWLKCGWEITNVLNPDYFYYNLNTKKVVPKQSRRKSVVKTPDGMTERQHAKLDNLTRVYDCGKIKLSI